MCVCWQSANLKQNEVWSLVPACQRVCVWHYQFEEANLKMESAERAKLSQTSIYGLQIPIMPQEEMTDCTQSSLGLQFVIYIFEFLTHLQKQFYGCVGALSLSFWKFTLSSSAGQEHLNLLTASPTHKKKETHSRSAALCSGSKLVCMRVLMLLTCITEVICLCFSFLFNEIWFTANLVTKLLRDSHTRSSPCRQMSFINRAWLFNSACKSFMFIYM